jgi:hypothetical protein
MTDERSFDRDNRASFMAVTSLVPLLVRSAQTHREPWSLVALASAIRGTWSIDAPADVERQRAVAILGLAAAWRDLTGTPWPVPGEVPEVPDDPSGL